MNSYRGPPITLGAAAAACVRLIVVPRLRTPSRARALQGATAMKSAPWRIAGTLALLGLGACSTQPWILSKSPDAITVRWYTDESSVVAADHFAALHCQSWGKAAHLMSDIRDGSAEIAVYRCY
jgi:hypothetical protein